MGKICTFCKYKRPENRCALIFSNASVKQTERCWNYEPVEDVAPVVHAEWKVNEHIELDFCSNCLEPVRRYVTAGQMDRSNYKGETFWNYCPHCGAKMDEKEGQR